MKRQTTGRLFNERDCRRGGALVEFAIFLPIILTILMMSIEAANGIYLRQAATTAAYEGARVLTAIGGTQDGAELRIQDILAARGVTKYEVNISPRVDYTTPRGTEIAITVSIVEKENRLPVHLLFSGGYFQSTIRMIRL